MHLSDYQRQAVETRQVSSSNIPDPIIPLLGLAGESGELLSEYKKSLRDGDSYRIAKSRIAEELGDLLWYLADVADIFELDLEDVGRQNLEKCSQRWGEGAHRGPTCFDREFPDSERFPRQLTVEIVNNE